MEKKLNWNLDWRLFAMRSATDPRDRTENEAEFKHFKKQDDKSKMNSDANN